MSNTDYVRQSAEKYGWKKYCNISHRKKVVKHGKKT